MEYLDFPYNIDGKSYLTSEEVLGYLHKYADHFNLMPHIKVRHNKFGLLLHCLTMSHIIMKLRLSHDFILRAVEPSRENCGTSG